MGDYLNPSNRLFQMSIRSKIYIDKTELIAFTNELMDTSGRFMCISRPRRFGKTMAMNMLAAYYSRGCDSAELVAQCKIAKKTLYEEHLNQHNVIRINMQEFLGKDHTVDGLLKTLCQYTSREIFREYPDVDYADKDDFFQVMKDVYNHTGVSFIILIDEWDCLFREYRQDKDSQNKYLDFLRNWLKDQEYIGLVYMTGILPIKKYGTHSALNMFTEYSMTDPGESAPFFGFTKEEVQELCTEYDGDYEELKEWYDGYEISYVKNKIRQCYSIYNPKSLSTALLRGECKTYWNRTETYESLMEYIQLNMDGLQDAVVAMMAGEHVPVNTEKFTNDMVTFRSRDDVLTLLVHLGYLNYNGTEGTVSIPNREVRIEYVNAVEDSWSEVAKVIHTSKKLVQALWDGDEASVAAGVDAAHEDISILQYNDENSLSCTIGMAFFSAVDYYNMVREMPAGRGFADIVFLPLPSHVDKPAILIELKWDQDADTAIRQIHEKRYSGVLKGYDGNILLAGISYDKGTKKYSCIIEKY